MQGKYADAFDLYDASISARVKNRAIPSILVSLNRLNNAFINLDIAPFSNFIRYFDYLARNPVSKKEKTTNFSRYFNYLVDIQDVNEAEIIVRKLRGLRSENPNHISQFHMERDEIKLFLCKGQAEQALGSLNSAIIFLDQFGEWKTIAVSDVVYFSFWELATRTYLLSRRYSDAHEVLQEKLDPWIRQYGCVGLLPRLTRLQVLYHESTGSPKEAERCRATIREFIESGRRDIAQKHFSEEVVQYLSYLVESAGDERLTGMFMDIRDRLATGLFPEYT